MLPADNGTLKRVDWLPDSKIDDNAHTHTYTHTAGAVVALFVAVVVLDVCRYVSTQHEKKKKNDENGTRLFSRYDTFVPDRPGTESRAFV